MNRRTPILTALVALLLLLTACSAGDPDSAPEPSPSASVSSAPPAPAAPKVGNCHRLSFDQATDPVDSGEPVPCGQPHTAETTRVGTLSQLADGHLLAVDSRTVQERIAKACPSSLAPYVGGDLTTQRLSRLEIVWFSPTVEEADAGADWFRCDVVGLRSEGRLLALPARMKGALDQPGALDTLGTCGTASPSARDFQRVACSVPHSWRAVDVVALPRSTRYLAAPATTAADAACQDVASARADGALSYTWAFEWPARAQFAAGQRYGYCWVPES